MADSSTCSDPFGCFASTSDFVHPILRPINLYPESASKVNTTFYLYAKWLQTNLTNLPKACLAMPLKFDPKHKPCVFTTNDLLKVDQLVVKLKEIGDLVPKKLKQNKWWTAVVIHGFLDSLHDSAWMFKIKNSLLQVKLEDPYNMVVLTDWTGGNGIPYIQATANTRLLGNQISYLLQKLNVSNH